MKGGHGSGSGGHAALHRAGGTATHKAAIAGATTVIVHHNVDNPTPIEGYRMSPHKIPLLYILLGLFGTLGLVVFCVFFRLRKREQ